MCTDEIQNHDLCDKWFILDLAERMLMRVLTSYKIMKNYLLIILKHQIVNDVHPVCQILWPL